MDSMTTGSKIWRKIASVINPHVVFLTLTVISVIVGALRGCSLCREEDTHSGGLATPNGGRPIAARAVDVELPSVILAATEA